MKDIRIFFQKEGAARFISHLDINRCMARCVRRAGLPLWYTEGFNPHPYLTFPLPLSLGVVGLKEPMDLRLIEDMPLDEVASRLGAAMPDGLSVIEVVEPAMKAKEIAFATYRVTVECDGKTADELHALLQERLDAPELPVTKKTKSGMKEIDIKPLIGNYSMRIEDDTLWLKLLLPAGCVTNINPTLVIGAVQGDDVLLTPQIIRDGIYNADMQAFA